MGQTVSRIVGQLRPGAASPGVDECGGKLTSPSEHLLSLKEVEDDVRIVGQRSSNHIIQEEEIIRVKSSAIVSAVPKRPRSDEENVDPRGTDRRPAKVMRSLPTDFPTVVKSRNRYPFLDDPETVDYVKSTRLMFVMKGPPGSGKTFLAKTIQVKYPDTVICSADDFLVDGESIRVAHRKCVDCVAELCAEQRRHIVVDGCHLRSQHWRPYNQLAVRHQYLLVLVEPDTTWRQDAATLATLNSHGQADTQIRHQLKGAELSVPLYFGWFLNPADSRELLARVGRILNQCLENERFRAEISQLTGQQEVTDVLSVYQRPAELLHCTTLFCGRGHITDTVHGYTGSEHVRRALGGQHVLRVTALLLTPRTLGARLTLDDRQMSLWAQDDHSVTPVGSTNPDRRPPPPPEWLVGDTEPSVVTAGSKRPAREGEGRRAHLTLGCRDGSPPVVTGNDLIQTLDRIQLDPESMAQPVAESTAARIYRIQDDTWYLDLKRDLLVDSLFVGRY